MRRDFKELFGAELFSLVGGLLTGFFLASVSNSFSEVPGLLIILPGFIALRGSVSGLLSANISTNLHLGVLRVGLTVELFKQVLRAFSIAIIASLTLSLLAVVINFVLRGVVAYELLLITLLAAVISSFFMIPFTVTTSFVLFSKGFNPDNFMGPLITLIGDIVGVLCLYVAVVVVL